MVSEWVKAGGVVALAASGVAAGSLSDELADVVGLLVPVVAPLLLALGGAVSILFRALQAETQQGRALSRDVADVVRENTVAAASLRAAVEQNTEALRQLAQAVGRLDTRVTELEHHARDRRKVA